MTRQKLITAISGAARLCSYSFYTGLEYRMDSATRELPAVWLIPPKLAKTDGREEGVKYYSVDIKLLRACADHTQEGKEELWAGMENDAARICLAICGNENVRSVTGLEYSPAEFTLTNRGELSISVSMTVLMDFSFKTDCR